MDVFKLFGVGVAIAAVLLAIVYVYTLWRAKSSTAGTQTTGDKVAAFVDQAAFLASLAAPYLIAKARGSTKILALFSEARIEAAKWDDPPVVVTTPVVTTDLAVVALQKAVVDLQAQIAKG